MVEDPDWPDAVETTSSISPMKKKLIIFGFRIVGITPRYIPAALMNSQMRYSCRKVFQSADIFMFITRFYF